MATKSGNDRGLKDSYTKADVKNRRGYDKQEFKGYINIHLNDTDGKNLNEWSPSEQEVMMTLDHYVYNGYQISFKYMEKDGAVKVTAMCKNSNDPNFGYVLSAWSGNMYTAAQALIYKWENKCPDGDWTVWLEENREYG